jgi:hypothetical protein
MIINWRIESAAAALLVLFLLPARAYAAPALDRCFDSITGVRACPDHKDHSLWYLFPAPLKLTSQDNGVPDYHLSLFHYAGRKGTGDEELFWAKGILTVSVERRRKRGVLKRIKQELSSRGIHRPHLRSIPVRASSVRLVFGDSVMESQSGTRWAGSTLTLPLNPDMARVLAGAIEKGPVSVVLMIDETVTGVKLRNGTWEEAEMPRSATLTVTLDPSRYPSNFTRKPLEQKMDMAYTEIEVRSYDIEENVVPDLYLETVEVALKVPGGSEVRSVQFRKGSGPVQTVKFSRAANLDVPYRVRVICVYRDGRSEEGPWVEKQGEAFLHIYRCMPQNLKSGIPSETAKGVQ